MKKTNFIICICAFAIISCSAKAQFGLGVGADYSIVAGSGSIKTPSINVGAMYGLNDDIGIFVNFRYFIPTSYKYSATANALSSATDPQYINVTCTDKISFYAINAGCRKYFFGGGPSDGGLFGSGGLGLVMGKESLEFSAYDKNLYDAGSYTGEAIGDAFGVFGLGYDLALGGLHICAEVPLFITMQGINSRTGSESPIPIVFSPGIFLRYDFGGNGGGGGHGHSRGAKHAKATSNTRKAHR
jgi:hypothetical protein